MKSFSYVSAASEAAAVKLLGDKALALAGGTDLLNLMKEYVLQPEVLVNIKSIPDTKTIEGNSRTGLKIGANVTLEEIISNPEVAAGYPALVQALWDVGSPQIRNQSTLGGNLCARPPCWYFRAEDFLCRKKGGPDCPAEGGENDFLSVLGREGMKCHAVHASSAAPALMAYQATVRIAGTDGAREVGIDEFFVPPDDGEHVLRENILKPNELITQISLPPNSFMSATYEVRHKESHDWPLALAVAVLDLDGRDCRSARICLGAVAPIPWRSTEAEAELKGKRITRKVAAAAGEKAVAGAQPMEKNGYKVKITRTAVTRAILAAAGLSVAGRG